jgi:hypothetical protein
VICPLGPDFRTRAAANACQQPGEEEHLIPLMVIAGAAGDARSRKVYSGKPS